MYNKLIDKYLMKNNLLSYDPYDIWKTSFGIKMREFYYKHKYLGLFPAVCITLFDLYINNKRRLFYKTQEYPIVRAQAALTLMNLYVKTKKTIYLEYANEHIDWLLQNYSKGYHGYCWGLNFVWVYSAKETYDENTPFSTHTPYPLEALVRYYELTNEEKLIMPIKSIFDFLEKDLQIMKENDEYLIISYGAMKDRIVTNSNSYVMYMYALLLPFFPEKKEYIEDKIYKIYNFLVSVQKDDGSWLYSPYDDNSFVDCFHSCFVIKNIYKTNKIIELDSATTIMNKGYKYINDHFFDKESLLYKRFSISNKPSLVKFDLYDNAEILNVANLLEDHEKVDELNRAIQDNFIESDTVYSTKDIFNTKRNADHLRWAVVPYLYAVSNIKEK